MSANANPRWRKKISGILDHPDHGHRAWQQALPDGQRRNWEMNLDPRSRWGRDTPRQLETMFKTYLELDGILWTSYAIAPDLRGMTA